MSHALDDERLELLSAYLDGEVDEPELRRAEALLAGEPAARTWLEAARGDTDLLRRLAPRVDAEALDQARHRAWTTARTGGLEAGPHVAWWERLRAALTPSRITAMAVPALAIVLAVLTPTMTPEGAPKGAPLTDDTVTVRPLSDAPPRWTVVVPQDPETLVVAMHLPEADVDLIWMMPQSGEKTRRRR